METDPKRDRQVIRTEDMDDATMEALQNAEIPQKAFALNHLMEEDGTAERRAIRAEELDAATVDAILTAEPGERSKDAGRRLPEPDDSDKR